MPVQRRPAVYNTEERAILDRYKNDYLAANSKEGRKQVLREMLAGIFNHWASKGEVIHTIEETSKEVVAWARNTWRLPKPATSIPKIQTHVKLTDALWLTREQDVLAEIATLLNVTEATTNTPGWFGVRMKAMGNILERMSPEDKAALEEDRQRISREGHPEALRRKMAVQHAHTRLTATAQQHWLDMGLLGITVFVRTTPEGQLAVEIHDKIAQTLGVTAVPFAKMFEDKAKELRRLVMNYVKALQGMLQSGAGVPGSAPTAPNIPIVLNKGYPRLPSAYKPNEHVKKALEDTYRVYIGTHYWIGTEGRTRQAPWKRMREDTLKYIDAEHLPRRDFVLDTPRNMHIGKLREFLAHIAEREKTFEIEKVFRFKYVDRTRKAHQDEDEDEDDDEEQERGLEDADCGTGGTEHGESSGDGHPIEGPGGAADDHRRHEEQDNANSTGGAASLEPSTNLHAVIPKKTKLTAKVPKKKQLKETQPDAAGTAGAAASSRSRPKAPPVTRPANEPTTTLAENILTIATGTHDNQQPTTGAVDGHQVEGPGGAAADHRRNEEQDNANSTGDAASLEPSTNLHAVIPKKTKLTAKLPKKKQPKKTQPDAAGAGGAAASSRSRPKAPPVTRPANEPTTTFAENILTIATGTHDNQQPTTGAEAPLRPRPQPRPVTRPANEPITTENILLIATGTQDNPQPQPQLQGRIPDTLIDPSLLAARNQLCRGLVNTSDNLALQEASRFAVEGKRIPKKRNPM